MKHEKSQDYPKGWDEQRVGKVLDYYEGQTDDEAVAEHEAALAPSATLIKVPIDLVPQVRELIAKHS